MNNSWILKADSTLKVANAFLIEHFSPKPNAAGFIKWTHPAVFKYWNKYRSDNTYG